MKNFVRKYGELIFIALVVVVFMATLIFFVLSGNFPGFGNPGPVAGATQNNGQELPKADGTTGSNTATNPNNDSNTQVTLKDGRVIKVGDQIQMVAPTYNEVRHTIVGTISSMQPQKKRALLWVPNGVVELTYRYVIDMKATKMVQTDEQQPDQSLTDTVRGVVTLDEQGNEIIHFLEDIDNPSWGWKYRAIQLDDTNTYTNLKIYNVAANPDSAPDYIVQFYRQHSPAVAA